jgi:hypothetical protein
MSGPAQMFLNLFIIPLSLTVLGHVVSTKLYAGPPGRAWEDVWRALH